MENDFSKNQDHLLAGELAKAAGVSTDTLRHYERKGVLKRPHRAANGYRLYPQSAVNRVLLVRKALTFGFTLDELARILNERDKGGAPCREVRRLVAEKISGIEDQLANLMLLRDELRSTLDDWDKRLSATNSNTQARLLENLISESAEKPRSFPAKKKPFPNLK